MALANPTPQAVVQLQQALRMTIDAGLRILIVGCPPGTFPHWMTKHPSLAFWPSTEAKVSDDRRIVPAEIGLILQTKMLSHALSANVRQQAKERKLICPADTFSPGAVLRLFDGIIERPTKEPDMAKVAQTQGPRPVDEREAAQLDDDTMQLVASIDDAIAGLELVKERIVALGTKFASVREQLDTLDHLKRLLK